MTAKPLRAQVETPRTTHVVIVRAEGDRALVERIRQELESGPFTVTELDPQPDAGAAGLAELARAHDAAAALRVQRSPTAVELWTARPIGDPDGTLDVIREPGASRHEQEVLVLRVVETLRALGLGLATSPEAAPPAAEPSPATAPASQPTVEREPERAREPAAVLTEAAPSPSRAPQLWLELSPALALSPGGFGPQLAAQLGVRYQPIALISISGFAYAPLWRSTLEEPEASADASTWIVGLAADAHYASRPFELSAGLGLASVITVMSGTSTTELEGVDETKRNPAPLARAALHLELGASLRLCLRALIGATLPEIAMRFVERDVATWGRPFVIVGLGLELPVIAHAAAQ